MIKIKTRIKFKIFLAWLIIFIQPFIFFGVARAQIATEEAPGGLLTAAVATAASAGSLVTAVGLPGIGAAQMVAADAAGVACKATDIAADSAGALAPASLLGSFAAIGGGTAESTLIQGQITALISLKSCLTGQLEILKRLPVTSLIQGQELVRRQNEVAQQIATIGQRIDVLRAQVSAGLKDVLKAVAIKLILNFSQQLTTRLINTLIAKFRIGNYLAYGNSLATFVYEKKFIQDNYPDKQNQLILAAMLNSDLVRQDVLPAIYIQAQRSLGFVPQQLVVSDPNYWTKLAMAGSPKANPNLQQTIFDGRAEQAKAQSQFQAQAEINQSKGFVPVRNCSGAVQQQQDIYKKNVQLSYQAYSDQAVLQKLQAQYAANPNNAKARSEMEKAASAVGKSTTALQNLPEQMDSPIVQICQAITNPGGFIGDGIQNLLKSNIDSGTLLQANNLPFYGQFLLSVASNLVNNIFQGGQSNLKILTDAGVTAANIASVDYLNGVQKPNDLINASKAVDGSGAFIAFDDIDTAKPQPTGTYSLKWSASAYPNVSRAVAVGISGASIPGGNALSGQANINFTLPGVYDFQLRIFTTTNTSSQPDKVLTERIGIAQTPPALSPGVKGAVITKNLDIRGSVVPSIVIR